MKVLLPTSSEHVINTTQPTYNYPTNNSHPLPPQNANTTANLNANANAPQRQVNNNNSNQPPNGGNAKNTTKTTTKQVAEATLRKKVTKGLVNLSLTPEVCELLGSLLAWDKQTPQPIRVRILTIRNDDVSKISRKIR